jgi:hypothetical protein
MQLGEIRLETTCLRPNDVLTMFEQILAGAHADHVFQVDPYLASRYRPSENDLSDALRLLFDPRTSRFACTFLLALIKAAKPWNTGELIRAIESDFSVDPVPIEVQREKHERVDISIVGRTFLVFIEKKIRGGSEREGQTKKQQRELEKLGIERGIPKSCQLGVFLTPEGGTAGAHEYVSLSTRRFAEILREDLSSLPRKDGREDSGSSEYRQMMLVRGFVESYDLLNGGGAMESARVKWYVKNYAEFLRIQELTNRIRQSELPGAVERWIHDALEKEPFEALAHVKFETGSETNYRYVAWRPENPTPGVPNFSFGVFPISGWVLTESEPGWGPWLYLYAEDVPSRERVVQILDSVEQHIPKSELHIETKKSPIPMEPYLGQNGETWWAYCAVCSLRDLIHVSTLKTPDVSKFISRARNFTEVLAPLLSIGPDRS